MEDKRWDTGEGEELWERLALQGTGGWRRSCGACDAHGRKWTWKSIYMFFFYGNSTRYRVMIDR